MLNLQQAGYSIKQLKILNNCQLFLQVTTLAEITNHVGTHLLPEVLKIGRNTPDLSRISQTNFQWPTQPNPDSTAWNLWT